ncbi:pyroglutamyl-peptidase I [Aquincola sp. J276]|uniref:pyroglutamyl-peptidase I n=1 Tax=Aquincola sp. J276 TaxID=2898432 RepID=UPI002150F451|nr:pyroglutamyl-peptidase I [Aquincola sp. J276]MCR5865017.1 pyroglutamyl-peptidase I [Aquincola sp. J276]
MHSSQALPTVLVTGFEPFGGMPLNPSGAVARALHGRQLELPGGPAAQVVGVVLPCVFGQSLRALDEALALHRPRLVLALGQADGRTDLSVERVAINVDDARIPDNAGAQPVDLPVVADGPAAYFSTLPIKAIVAALKAAGHPASVSQTAGTFVCNHVFFGLQHRLAGSGVRSGFMHVPLLPQQAALAAGVSPPSLALVLQIEAVVLALQVALGWQGQDLQRGGGALD